MVTSEQVLAAFRRRLQSNKKLASLLRSADGYGKANDFAKTCGKELAKVIADVASEFAGLDAKAVYSILEPSLRENYAEVAKFCKYAQKAIYRDAGLGLGALEPAYSEVIARNAYRVAEGIAEATEPLTLEGLANLVAHAGMTVVDTSIDTNAEAAANMGLETHIVRTYDGVGLHDGKDPCKWCMDRAGDWTDYKSAYDAGCFERHPGCGCRIDYHVGKTRTWSNRAGTWR